MMMLAATSTTTNNLLLWISDIIGFSLLVAFFVWFAPRRILRGRSIGSLMRGAIDARAVAIETQLRLAEESRVVAQKAHEEAEAEIAHAHEEAAQIVERATGMRQSLQQELVQAAEEEKQRIISQARDEIEAERNRAILDLRSRAADVAVDAAGEILRRSMDTRVDHEIIMRALAEGPEAGGAGL